MEIGRVIGTVTSTIKHTSYEGKRMLVVQEYDLNGEPNGVVRVAIDYVGAGEGDLVLIGGAPGVAAKVFGISKAPIRDLIMGIVDHVDINSKQILGLYDE